MSELEALRAKWLARWEDALACWSRYTRLSAPRICVTREELEREKMSTAFALIRLVDHAVAIDLAQIVDKGLESHALAVLAHEIGHHVYCPGDLSDHARVIARVRRALPTREHLAPFVSNLWSDLLINDRLHRSAGVDMAAVYRALGLAERTNAVWWIYLRTYELLWGLTRGSLAERVDSSTPEGMQLEGDAQLAARVVRAYSKDFVRGAGRFASLLLGHLLTDDAAGARQRWAILNDTESIGAGGEVDGLSEVDEGEDDVLHPAEDPEVTGRDTPRDETPSASPRSRGVMRTGTKTPRGPREYGDLLRAIGAYTDEDDVAIRYYTEQARPHLVPFPRRESPRATEPQPEGLEVWEPGSPIERVDWVESVVRSPVVIPGVTTMERTYGESPGADPAREPLDLYVGIDCSGSMGNPRLVHSHAIVAGAVLALSALRAGARVKVVLSGEPGRTISTPGFERDARTVMKLLTSYLGTGTAFGIHRLRDTFADDWPTRRRAVHVLVVTDSDVFGHLGAEREGRSGWSIARDAIERARGGGTYVLRLDPSSHAADVARMRQDGWDVHHVRALEELVAFARAFARSRYHRARR
ncbi:vWA domain-containing protein [Sandaracinus amylolyticus]|uniref:VWA domain-containing protein n=1 Tax=Sandaracinus amylolyticus TaxID=927083 RepID=A0A0F6W490_9BACT|nr:VWA domain-containing protein [Sandaracinus amylolyticus]AKF07017.1 hypothetical protein DB32_004166 [Sandaracinus amylolyticus]